MFINVPVAWSIQSSPHGKPSALMATPLLCKATRLVGTTVSHVSFIHRPGSWHTKRQRSMCCVCHAPRQEIEVFFKFIKQHLNFSHLLNRSENGIKIVMYITMIVSILLEHYKTINNIKGYKIAKKKFAQDLETDIIYNIVILCGGSPQKAKSMLYKKSP